MKRVLIALAQIIWNWKPAKFFIVNGLGGILAFILFCLMADYWKYSQEYSALASQFFCQLFNFFPQKYVVFKEKDFHLKAIRRESLQYIFVGTVIIGLNTWLIKLASSQWPFHPAANQIVVSFILNFPSYLMNEKIFKKTAS